MSGATPVKVTAEEASRPAAAGPEHWAVPPGATFSGADGPADPGTCAAYLKKTGMDKQNLYPPDQYPPTNILAAAIRQLPKAGPGVRAQKVEIDAGPAGRYRVTFIVRQNTDLSTPSWYWGVESSERVAEPGGGLEEPGSGTPPD